MSSTNPASAQRPVVALLKAEQQPAALIEDSERRVAVIAGATIAFYNADEATQALVEAVLLPKDSRPPAWADKTGMMFIGIMKEIADEWIKAQRKERTKKAKARLNLRLVSEGVQ